MMEATDRRQADREELVARLTRLLPDEGYAEPWPGLVLGRADAATDLVHGVSVPAFCVIAQGSKEILLGDQTYHYDPAHYLITTAALPIAGRVTAASPERPSLSLNLRLDPALVGTVIIEAGHVGSRGQSTVPAIDVSPLEAGLLDATVRLIRLLDNPDEARILVPMVTREIVYRLLKGAQGGRLGQVVALGGQPHRIARAIARLQQDLSRPLRVEDLAGELGMSVSGFHYHFKAVTAMSPVRFQRQLRLQEARRLMLGEGVDAATAGRRVGYDDPAYFSREYKRLFGAPPLRHVGQLREGAVQSAAL